MKVSRCEWATLAVVDCELGRLVEKFWPEMIRVMMPLQWELEFLVENCERGETALPLDPYELVAEISFSWSLSFWQANAALL